MNKNKNVPILLLGEGKFSAQAFETDNGFTGVCIVKLDKVVKVGDIIDEKDSENNIFMKIVSRNPEGLDVLIKHLSYARDTLK